MGKTSNLNIDTVVNIDDLATFDTFGHAALMDDKITLRLSGSPELKALSITFSDVTLEKDTTITGKPSITFSRLRYFKRPEV